MKNILEYINNNDKWQPSLNLRCSNEYFYEQLEDFYEENNIPNKYIKLFENNELYKIGYDYIKENLQTHDYKKLQNQLLKEYGDYIEGFKDYSGEKNKKSFYIILKNQKPKYNLEKSDFDLPLLSVKGVTKKQQETDKFFNILRFFNYQYSQWKFVDNKYCLFIEPIYSEEVSDYFDKCHRQAYHFTDKENVDKILKNGLRLRRGTYRNFPERIYLWASDKPIEKDNQDIILFIRKIFGNNSLELNDVGIIKVDLYNTKILIYKDTAMGQKEALFVYNSIPPNLCKEVKL